MDAERYAEIEKENALLKRKVEALEEEKKDLEENLSMAVKLKYHLMPNVFPAFPDIEEIDIFADTLQIKQLGGDFYDMFRIDADHIGIVIADIFDGGKAAALYMVAFKLYLKGNIMMDDSIEQRVEFVNDLLCWGNHNNLSLSAWFGIYEISTGILKVVNAGHEKALILSDGKVWSHDEKISYLLGVIEGMKYESFEIKMEKGTKLLICTDGVNVAQNSEGEEYSVERLRQAYSKTEGMSAEETIALLQEDFKGFVGDVELKEDATYLCLARKGGD